MDGYGPGYGMAGGYSQGSDPSITTEKRRKIGKIQRDVRRKHWDLIGMMQDEQSKMNEQYDSDPRDDAALGKTYRDMSDLRQQMFDLSLGAQCQIDAVLNQGATPEAEARLTSHVKGGGSCTDSALS